MDGRREPSEDSEDGFDPGNGPNGNGGHDAENHAAGSGSAGANGHHNGDAGRSAVQAHGYTGYSRSPGVMEGSFDMVSRDEPWNHEQPTKKDLLALQIEVYSLLLLLSGIPEIYTSSIAKPHSTTEEAPRFVVGNTPSLSCGSSASSQTSEDVPLPLPPSLLPRPTMKPSSQEQLALDMPNISGEWASVSYVAVAAS
jgi:hypothetical protein